MSLLPSHPILDPSAAAALEQSLLLGEEQEWAAMQWAGEGVAAGIRRDLAVTGAGLPGGRLLVLAGKGHNGGDAMLAAAALARVEPRVTIDLALVLGERQLRPLAARAWRTLEHAASGRVRVVRFEELARDYTVIIDGVFGLNFEAPVRQPARDWLSAAQTLTADLRVAVDLPSGLAEPSAFRADVTYATGIVKRPLLGLKNAGRLRYIDLGFFRGGEEGQDRVLTAEVLAPLRGLRPAHADKRTFGHVFVIGGSRQYPGAVLMSVQAAVRSGAGLVTAFVPESLAPAYAAACPEAMWYGCPETPAGGLALEGPGLLLARIEKADALVIGPGLGREVETLTLAKDVVRQAKVPLVVDADALQHDMVWSGSVPRVLTPHAGEFQRIAGGATLRDFKSTRGSVTVLKGPVTQLSDGSGTVYHELGGGPVLARGGSGDMLAGMIGALLAQAMARLRQAAGGAEPVPHDLYPAVLETAAQGVYWHARAAELLAVARGEVAVRATELLDFLGPALRVRAVEQRS